VKASLREDFMRFARFGLLFCLLLLNISVWAQQTATTSPQGAVHLQQALGALAGATSIADVTLSGTARRIAGSDDETGTVVLKAMSTGEARADFSFPSGPRSEVYANSEKGPVGSWSGPDGVSKAIPLYNALVDSAWFSPALMLGKLSSSSSAVVSYAGAESHRGLAVEHLSASRQFPNAPSQISALMQRHSQMEVYVDPSTSLPTAISFNTHPDKDAFRDIPVEIQYSDYRLVNGVQTPFHVQKYFNGGLILDLQFERADLNTGLSPSSFSVPLRTITPPIYRSAH
jgi:hypothetical protein